MSCNDIAIRVENLSKRYEIYTEPRDRLKQFILPPIQRFIGRRSEQYFREFWALKNVSFEVKEGETVGVIGRNGSGKSTLLQMICGTLSPTSGGIQTNGRIAALLELGAGFSPDFTGRENVYLYASVLGLSNNEIESRFDDIAAFADIGDFMDQPVKFYSSGMYVRLAFSVAINVEPKILIIDEALAVGDEAFQRKCYSRIERIRDLGATILLVTHGASTITQMCSRALVLDHGHRIYMGNPKVAVESYHRLLYASSLEAKKIADELRLLDSIDKESKDRSNQALTPSSKDAFVPPEVDALKVDSIIQYYKNERFDSGLVPVSTMNYESIGANISNIRIENKHGEIVNILSPGDTYYYCYNVLFWQPAEHVHFGMLIKTTTGNDLAALGSHLFGHGIKKTLADETYYVQFPFINVFSPGTYFMNAGCSGLINGTEKFLHRIIDAIAFRVEETKMGLRYAGPVQISTGEICSFRKSNLDSRESL